MGKDFERDKITLQRHLLKLDVVAPVLMLDGRVN
jgi:hypothetical protein